MKLVDSLNHFNHIKKIERLYHIFENNRLDNTDQELINWFKQMLYFWWHLPFYCLIGAVVHFTKDSLKLIRLSCANS